MLRNGDISNAGIRRSATRISSSVSSVSYYTQLESCFEINENLPAQLRDYVLRTLHLLTVLSVTKLTMRGAMHFSHNETEIFLFYIVFETLRLNEHEQKRS